MNRRNDPNLATYDRTRVVTTELHRILGKGRTIQLRLGPKVNLSLSEWEKALRWGKAVLSGGGYPMKIKLKTFLSTSE